MTRPIHGPTHRVRLRSESDLLALVPYCLGFTPEDSLVSVCLDGAGRPFLARVDLPTSAEVSERAAAELARAASVNAAVHAFCVVYSDHALAAALACGDLAAALAGRGVDLGFGLRVEAERWWRLEPFSLPSVDDTTLDPGTPFDLSSHPLTSQGVLEGRVMRRGRRELEATLHPLLDEIEGVVEAMRALPDLPPVHAAVESSAAGSQAATIAAEVAWIVDRTRRDGRGPLADPAGASRRPRETARLLRGAAHPQVVDALLGELDRATAELMVPSWVEAVRRAPEGLVAPAASLLALCAWLAGDGALAWCAVDRALAEDPSTPLAVGVARVLEHAVPPSRWPGRTTGVQPGDWTASVPTAEGGGHG